LTAREPSPCKKASDSSSPGSFLARRAIAIPTMIARRATTAAAIAAVRGTTIGLSCLTSSLGFFITGQASGPVLNMNSSVVVLDLS